jgi:hypothetical protein
MVWTIPQVPAQTQALAKALQDPLAIRLANEGQQVQAACRAIEVLPIVDQNDLDQLGAGMKEAKGRLNELERERRALTDPKLADVEIDREKYRPVERAYAALLAAMKARTAKHFEETAAKQQAAQLAAGQAFQAGEQVKAFDALAAAPLPAHTDGVGVRFEWTVAEIVNPGMVPREYCEPVPALIRATFRPSQEQDPAPIPGVKFSKRSVVAVRG